MDRWGLRSTAPRAVSLWSLASAVHGLVQGLPGLCAARCLLGFGEGATFPSGLRAAVESLPPERRSTGIAISYSGGSMGAMITPLLITPVALRYGWRMAFAITALSGMLWVIVWRWVAPPVNPALTTAAATELNSSSPRNPGIGTLLTPFWSTVWDTRLWAMICAYGLGALPLGFVLYATPIYLSKVLHVSQASLGHILWIPAAGWEVGYFFWGWFADRFAVRTACPRSWLLALTILSFPLGATCFTNWLWLSLTLFFFATFITAGFIILGLRYGASVYPLERTGFIAGVGSGSWSALVALIMPFVGHMFDRDHYALSFLLVSLFPTVGFLGWLLLSQDYAKKMVAGTQQ
jgi:ACS family hexuronate transporter-like MFS transporter